MDLDTLNRAAPEEAAEALQACCASSQWVEGMLQRRPFADTGTALAKADEVWWQLGEEDWLEAFAAHPRIGDRTAGSDRLTLWSRAEQSGVAQAESGVLADIAASNQAYEHRFGYVFLAFASGRTAADLLAECRLRLESDPDEELLIAAGEQATITALRLRRLLGID